MSDTADLNAANDHSNGFANDKTNSHSNGTETSLLIKLAQTITRETEKIDVYLKENSIPAPSFEEDGLVDFPRLPEDIQKARLEVVRATVELKDLIVGPTESVRWLAWDVSLLFSDFS